MDIISKMKKEKVIMYNFVFSFLSLIYPDFFI